MKKVQQHLTEGIELDDVIGQIPTSIKNSALLYRSFNNSYGTLRDVGKSQVRKGRTPIDTPIALHKLFDEVFYEQHKMKPRSDSLFCSKSLQVAKNYADNVDDIYVVIPMGAKYIYSHKILDLFQTFKDHTLEVLCKTFGVPTDNAPKKTLVQIAKNNTLFDSNIETIKALFVEMVKTYTITSTLNQCPKVGEIMVVCNDFYYINLMMVDTYEVKTYADLEK